jgi:hypothetical protein
MNYQDHILTILHRAGAVKTNQAKRKNLLDAVHALKTVRRILQNKNRHQWLEKMREQLEASALSANIPSDLEGKITKPKDTRPKRPYGVKRIKAINHAFWRACNPEKVPSDLE